MIASITWPSAHPDIQISRSSSHMLERSTVRKVTGACCDLKRCDAGALLDGAVLSRERCRNFPRSITFVTLLLGSYVPSHANKRSDALGSVPDNTIQPPCTWGHAIPY